MRFSGAARAGQAQTLVLYGDVPLTRSETLINLVANAGGGMALLTVELENAAGYGRIVRVGGAIKRIVEDKDADARSAPRAR
jgi:bifunctional UDP-N-acetylglucosamine pyrophosphorylase/glucosamine-1-phosphate N-acetyltransferase